MKNLKRQPSISTPKMPSGIKNGNNTNTEIKSKGLFPVGKCRQVILVSVKRVLEISFNAGNHRTETVRHKDDIRPLHQITADRHGCVLAGTCPDGFDPVHCKLQKLPHQ